MDFGTLLHVARKNSESVKNSEGKYYSTKFSAPKKETKEKRLSDNIKKFLAKKEEEERAQARLKKEKLSQLLSIRDEKSKNKIRKMLKVTKSANKSVLEDAIDNNNTAVTLQGPDQPDEDDYGYVSHEAAAFYQKYMDKVKAIPAENKFAPSKSSIKGDLSGTKDRVKEAIKKEQEEKNNPQRTRSSKTIPESAKNLSSTSVMNSFLIKKDLYDPAEEREREKEEQKRQEEERKKAKLKKPAPPPMDFKELLRLAEKKQYEPVEIVVEVEKEPERLLTKKQKKELEERKAYLEEREKKERSGNSSNNKTQSTNGKILKGSDTSSSDSRKPPIPSSSSDKISKPSNSSQPQKASPSPSTAIKNGFKKPISSITTSKTKPTLNSKPNNHIDTKVKNNSPGTSNVNVSNNKGIHKPINGLTPSKAPTSTKLNANTKPASALATSQKCMKQSSLINSAQRQERPQIQKTPTSQKSSIQQQNSKDIKSRPPIDKERGPTRQFPPSDIRNYKPVKKPIKRRIIDDDDYDSELDDFIDDGPENGSENYSNYIKEIFGYDKSRYRDYDDDDQNMESNFVQQMKEEQLSKKIGIMEDLEDMRLEAEEKRKKMLMKKKKLK